MIAVEEDRHRIPGTGDRTWHLISTIYPLERSEGDLNKVKITGNRRPIGK